MDKKTKLHIDKKEQTSKSELINEMNHQASKQYIEADWIKAQLEIAEKSGFTELNQEQILQEAKSSFSY